MERGVTESEASVARLEGRGGSTKSGPGDGELVGRCRGGDLSAFDRLVRRHRERALAAARRQVADDAEAEDLVQEAFIEAFRSLPTLRDGAKFGPWLGVILQRVAARHHKAHARGREALSAVSLDGPGFVTHLASPQEDAATAQVRERVRASLAELTRQNRQILSLFYLEGLRCREIAERLRLPLGTVKRRLHDSRNRFRKEWRKMAMPATAAGVGRRLNTWVWGQGNNESFPLMSSLLAQSIALAINKRAKAVAQIADEVGADAAYVGDVLDRMARLELAQKQRSDRYVLDFIALDRDDHEKLRVHTRAVGKKIAEQLAAKIPEVRAAYERSDVAARGWDWEGAQWIVVPVFVCNAAIRYRAPEIFQMQPPLRPDGQRYWFMGSEAGMHASESWVTGCNMCTSERGGTAHFWTPQVKKASTDPLGLTAVALMRALVKGPKTLREVLAEWKETHCATPDALSKMVEGGYARRRGSRFQLLFPVYQKKDFDVLMPALKEAVEQPTRSIFLPGALALDGMLARLGYGHLKEQFVAMRGKMASDMMGWTLTHLVEMGALPTPPETAPATWGFYGWLGQYPFWRLRKGQKDEVTLQ